MFTLNSSTLSGEVVDVSISENGTSLFSLKQNVFGMFPTTFHIFCPKGISPPEKGSRVLVLNALAYDKNGERRFKVSAPTQIQKGIIDINEHSFTGIVKRYRQAGDTKNVIIEISQDVDGKLPTTFFLFVPVSQQEEYLKGQIMDSGDYVVVSSASCYEKDGELRYKVPSMSNLGIVYYKNYDKGVMDAKEIRR